MELLLVRHGVAEEGTPDAPRAFTKDADALAWLKRRRDERVVLVGHEPHLSGLASWLMTGRDRSVLELKKAQAVLLDLPSLKPGTARLLWSLPPKALRKI